MCENNFDLTNVVTPVRVDVSEDLLREAQYDEAETRFITNGFRFGFPIGYDGAKERKQLARNLPIRCGSKMEQNGQRGSAETFC